MEGRKEGRMDGWMEGRKDGWMDGRKEGGKDGWMYGWIEGRMIDLVYLMESCWIQLLHIYTNAQVSGGR